MCDGRVGSPPFAGSHMSSPRFHNAGPRHSLQAIWSSVLVPTGILRVALFTRDLTECPSRAHGVGLFRLATAAPATRHAYRRLGLADSAGAVYRRSIVVVNDPDCL